MQEAATDALALADDLGWDRFSLVGHSIGAKAPRNSVTVFPCHQRVSILGYAPVSAGP